VRGCARFLFDVVRLFSCHVAGPLMAAVDAQAMAAFTTLSFIQNVGFDNTGKVINSQFTYNITNTTTNEVQENTMSVPLLTILPIPYLRVSFESSVRTVASCR
jgi:hypothetical protein